MARLKLDNWENVIADCETCLGLAPENMKAHYYLAQAQLSIDDFDSALTNALAAHKICAATEDTSLRPITDFVLRCKKERWEDREKKRLRQERQLEEEMVALLLRKCDPENETEPKITKEEADEKIKGLKEAFEDANTESLKRPKVPDWAIDEISFAIMVDPVTVSQTIYTYDSFFCSNIIKNTDKNRQILRARLHHGSPPPLWHRSYHSRTA